MRLDDFFPSNQEIEKLNNHPAVIHHPIGTSISYPLLYSLSIKLKVLLLPNNIYLILKYILNMEYEFF